MATFFTNEVTIFISFEVGIFMATMSTVMKDIVLRWALCASKSNEWKRTTENDEIEEFEFGFPHDCG
jgi:hypothetical protein